MTVLDLITRALRLLGAINVGSTPTADEQADALLALNAMVEAWANERLMMFTSAREVFSINAAQQVYQLGPTATDWIAARPQYIDAAGLLLANSDPTQVLERPLRILRHNEEWARVRMKAVQSTLPTMLYYEPDFPNGQVALWPVPNQNNQIAIYTPIAVAQFTSLTQTISLPPGYARALPYNLAVELSPEFDREPSAIVLAIAEGSKSAIKRANVPASMGRLRVDRALQSAGGHFDVYLGESR